jgi:hypothetical protein
MLTTNLLDTTPLWLLFLLTALLLVGGNALGFRLGAWQRSRRADDDKAPSNAIMGSTLGLLAFIMAFTFGMSHTRFDTRRTLVLDEASAILRAHQAAQFLPEPQRTNCTSLLIDYVDLRIEITGLSSMAEIHAVILESEGIQDRLRNEAASLADRPNAVLSMFLRSLNELTDLQMKRVRAAVWNRIPTTIEVMLYALAFMGLMTMGYNAGLAASRPMLPTLVLALAFSAIITLIVDLERPRQTLFEVSQEPMVSVQQRLGR